MTMQDLIREGYWPSDSIPTLPLSNVEAYWDASVSESVDAGAGKLRNLVTPASGATKTDYDLTNNGALQVGTPGAGHQFAYYNAGGDDRLQAQAKTTESDTWQTSNSDFTIALLITLSEIGSNEVYFTTQSSGGDGVKFGGKNNSFLEFSVSGTVIASTDTPPTLVETILLALSVDRAADTGFFYENGSYIQSGGSNTFDPNATNANSSALTLFGVNGGGYEAPIGTKLHAGVLSNVGWTKSELDQLYRHFQAQGRA